MVRLCVDVCGHKCMTGLMMVYDCGRENASGSHETMYVHKSSWVP